jgi:hypothetical protein
MPEPRDDSPTSGERGTVKSLNESITTTFTSQPLFESPMMNNGSRSVKQVASLWKPMYKLVVALREWQDESGPQRAGYTEFGVDLNGDTQVELR